MEIGKLPSHLLEELLSQAPIRDPRVLLGPAVGEDAAVIEMDGDRVLIAKTDPITFVTDQIGWYAVHINANDIAASGGTPKWFLASLLIPEKTSQEAVKGIFDQMQNACKTLQVEIIGGHTEITYNLDRPIIVGAMLGEAKKGDLTPTSSAKVGDRVLLIKGIAIEGTSILAKQAAIRLLELGISREMLERARGYLTHPGISIVPDASIARKAAKINCMHDPTEGGLITGLREIAYAASVGLRIDASAIPILSECREICSRLGLDPLGLLASGALVMTLEPDGVPKIINALEEANITVHDIGEVVPASEGLTLVKESQEIMPAFARDELARFFSEAM